MQWSGATGAIARCKTRLPGAYASADPCALGTGYVAEAQAEGRQQTLPHSIRHGLDKPGIFTTVSSNLYVSYRGRGDQSGLRGRSQRPQGSGSHATAKLAPEAGRARRPRRQAARTKKRLADATRRVVLPHRYLFVQRHLNKTERKTLWRVSRGLPQLQTLRAIMDQVYALFDRRCRTQTALDKLAKLRRRVQRFTARR